MKAGREWWTETAPAEKKTVRAFRSPSLRTMTLSGDEPVMVSHSSLMARGLQIMNRVDGLPNLPGCANLWMIGIMVEARGRKYHVCPRLPVLLSLATVPFISDSDEFLMFHVHWHNTLSFNFQLWECQQQGTCYWGQTKLDKAKIGVMDWTLCSLNTKPKEREQGPNTLN